VRASVFLPAARFLISALIAPRRADVSFPARRSLLISALIATRRADVSLPSVGVLELSAAF